MADKFSKDFLNLFENQNDCLKVGKDPNVKEFR